MIDYMLVRYIVMNINGNECFLHSFASRISYRWLSIKYTIEKKREIDNNQKKTSLLSDNDQLSSFTQAKQIVQQNKPNQVVYIVNNQFCILFQWKMVCFRRLRKRGK